MHHRARKKGAVAVGGAVRGVPAAVFEDHVVLVAADATITVFVDSEIGPAAVDALRPAGPSTTADAAPPKSSATVVDGKLRNLRCPG
jgi:hypothetical protein